MDHAGVQANLFVHGPPHGALQIEPHLHRQVRARVAQVSEMPESAPSGTVLTLTPSIGDVGPAAKHTRVTSACRASPLRRW